MSYSACDLRDNLFDLVGPMIDLAPLHAISSAKGAVRAARYRDQREYEAGKIDVTTTATA